MSPARPTKVLVVVRDGAGAAESLYLTTALAVGSPPQFEAEVVPVSKLNAAALSRARVVMISDATMPGTMATALKESDPEEAKKLFQELQKEQGAVSVLATCNLTDLGG